MSRYKIPLVIFIILLTACNAPSGASKTRTTVNVTFPPTWTPVATLTSTMTPSSTPTMTLTPTSTPALTETAIRATETWTVLMLTQLQEKALRVCRGEGAAEAGEYVAPNSEPNPFVICYPSDTTESCSLASFTFAEVKGVDFTGLDPKEISELRLVVCMELKMNVVQTCTYRITGSNDPIKAQRVQMIYTYTVFAARTGKKLATIPLAGGPPMACPESVVVTNGVNPTFGGMPPKLDGLFAKLNRFVHAPIE